MALSLINYFFLDIPDARIPFMILDALVVWGLNSWEKRYKESTQEVAIEASKQHEVVKKMSTAEKAALKTQRKAEDKKLHVGNKSVANGAPKQHIQQPDKNKKSR